MWPGCNSCGAPVPTIQDQYCGGRNCIGKAISYRQSSHTPHTKKKITKAVLKARRKKGRK